VADIGETLGVGAHLTALRRIASGPARIADAISMEALIQMAETGDFSTVLHGEDYLLCDLPVIRVSEYTAQRMVQGIVPHMSELVFDQQDSQGFLDGVCPPETLCRVYGERRGFFALVEIGSDPVRPARIRRIIKTRF
jgi:tRNA U55 pseudouridine synthase TruB